MAADSEILIIPAQLPVLAANGGLFVSRGIGTHPQRVIDSFELIYVRVERCPSRRKAMNSWWYRTRRFDPLAGAEAREGTRPYP